MNKFLTVFRNWFAYAAMITLVCGVIYVTVQQSYRMSANDPQFQADGDAAIAIGKGADPKTLTDKGPTVDISQSLALWLIIYDAQGSVAATNATLDGTVPRFPKAVLDHVRNSGIDALTWQPRSGIRQATVSVHTNDYTVVAGRSLRLTEQRISLLGRQVFFGWAMSLLAMALVVLLLQMPEKRPAID